jgi:putative DNA primase/helicase
MTRHEELTIDDYKAAVPMAKVLEDLDLDTPNGTGKIPCPIHDESTPSCHVYESRIYCYGCGVSMDSIDLIMKLKGIGFKDAVRRLAKIADLPDPNFNGDMEGVHRKQAELVQIYTRFFEKSKKHSAIAVDYLRSRWIDPDNLGNLELGFFSVAHELDDEERELAQRAGLLTKSGNFLLAGAVVIPITRDHEIVSLYGRMGNDQLAPRHVYPSRTDPPMPSTVWGLDDCRSEEEIYLVEGIIDAITLRSQGIANSVAVFGTQGLTRERQKLLQKAKIRRINLAFDNDANASGDKAVLKSGRALFEAGLSVKVITLPRPANQEKADANSYFKDHNQDDFLNLSRRDFVEFFTDSIPTLADPQDQYRALKPLLEVIAHQPQPTWSHYVKKLQEKFPGFQASSLQQEMKKLVRANKSGEPIDDKKFKPLPFVQQIMAEMHVLYHAGNFYRYEGGVYKYWHDEKVDLQIISVLGPEVQTHEIDSVKRILRDFAFKPPEEVNRTGVFNIKNGVLDLNTGEFCDEHSPEILSTVQSEVSFDWTVEWPKWKAFLDDVLPEEDMQSLLSEIFGYCLTSNVSHHKAFFLYGDGHNGKSVVIDVLEAVVGAGNCSALMLSDINHNFRLAELVGKLVNIVVETEAKSLLADGRFKSVVAGDVQTAEKKYGNPFKFRPFAKWIISCNNLPVTRDKSYGFERRIVILPFKKEVPLDRRNPNLAEEIIAEELSGVLNWAIGGYRRLAANKCFTNPAASKRALEDYKDQIDPVLLFMRECLSKSKNKKTPLKKIYSVYKAWCDDYGYMAVSARGLRDSIEKEFKIEKNRQNTGVYLPVVIDDD